MLPPAYYGRVRLIHDLIISKTDTMDKLLAYLHAIHPLPKGLGERLKSIVQAKELARKEHLVRTGKLIDKIYFVETGLLRCYYERGTKEISSWFMREGDICIATENFFRQKFRYENIQALEKSLLYYISYDELERIYQDFPEFNFTARLLAQRYYILTEQRLGAMRLQRSPERYAWLVENFPELVQRVPLKYLASYIGITDVMLSILRRKNE